MHLVSGRCLPSRISPLDSVPRGTKWLAFVITFNPSIFNLLCVRLTVKKLKSTMAATAKWLHFVQVLMLTCSLCQAVCHSKELVEIKEQLWKDDVPCSFAPSWPRACQSSPADYWLREMTFAYHRESMDRKEGTLVLSAGLQQRWAAGRATLMNWQIGRLNWK